MANFISRSNSADKHIALCGRGHSDTTDYTAPFKVEYRVMKGNERQHVTLTAVIFGLHFKGNHCETASVFAQPHIPGICSKREKMSPLFGKNSLQYRY